MTRPRKPCGTIAAYKWHVSHGEVACEPCLAAERAYRACLRHPPGAERQAAMLGQLIALIAAECDHAGLLPGFKVGAP